MTEEMKYGQIAGNKHINATIYHCFEYIRTEDQQKFLKKFQQQNHESDQIMHTFRELVLGAYLSSMGYRVRNEHVINDRTPDWTIMDADAEAITGIIELMSFHIDKLTEIGVDYVQGFALGEPRPIVELVADIKKSRSA